jgi:hypothetical protein
MNRTQILWLVRLVVGAVTVGLLVGGFFFLISGLSERATIYLWASPLGFLVSVLFVVLSLNIPESTMRPRMREAFVGLLSGGMSVCICVLLASEQYVEEGKFDWRVVVVLPLFFGLVGAFLLVALAYVQEQDAKFAKQITRRQQVEMGPPEATRLYIAVCLFAAIALFLALFFVSLLLAAFCDAARFLLSWTFGILMAVTALQLVLGWVRCPNCGRLLLIDVGEPDHDKSVPSAHLKDGNFVVLVSVAVRRKLKCFKCGSKISLRLR